MIALLLVALVSAEKTVTPELSKKYGGLGQCLTNIIIPDVASFSCDPPNQYPQICTLLCEDGYYSTGTKDIACADSICKGECKQYYEDITENSIEYSTRECNYKRWIECEETESGLCLETVTEPCQYSYYVEKRRNICSLIPENPPMGCPNSGCMGTCDKPGTFHYYSSRCINSCPPWRDPLNPEFKCKKCNEPPKLANTIIEYIKPSQIRYLCPDGTWGTPSVSSYCMAYDGSWYPMPPAPNCKSCIAPNIEDDIAGFHVILEKTNSRITIGCRVGYVGEEVTTTCSSLDGTWSHIEYPLCTIWSPIATSTTTPSITPSPSITSISSSPEASPSTIQTPSPSRTPRPPKVKGSRAPSPKAKY
jgi:hypothetical protein